MLTKRLFEYISMKKVSIALAKTLLNAFERHIFLYRQVTNAAKDKFVNQSWHQIHEAAKARTDYFEVRVKEAVLSIQSEFEISSLDKALWRQVKSHYITLLDEHPQAELAESFYNSVFCQLFERKYYHNDFIFVEATLATRSVNPGSVLYDTYYLGQTSLPKIVTKIIEKTGLSDRFSNLKSDIKNILSAFSKRSSFASFFAEEMVIEVVSSVFYRNKGAYIIGRVRTDSAQTPFIVPIVHNEKGGLKADALITDPSTMAVVFGFARAYFFVDCQYPSLLVDFLQQLIPHKTRAELYSSIGFHKQGKTQFYRDFLNHLKASDDQFELAAGIKGMVMSVFTLPSYPYVFKVIKDKFAPSKQMTRKDVKGKYRLVKLHDRVGRMADTMEYSEVAFPKNRFSASLLEELTEVAPSLLREEGQDLVISHVYIERRMTPLNLYLAKASEEQIDNVMLGYGRAIKQLIAANIFPGDMLLKNFGVTRHGRVIFYDYDEITYMNEVNFRTLPEPETEEQIYAAQPWYSVAPGDVFPEELATFALANPKYRKAFMVYHADLLTAKYWQTQQEKVAKGQYADVFPYPDHLKFD